jgi:hypothetical protein
VSSDTGLTDINFPLLKSIQACMPLEIEQFESIPFLTLVTEISNIKCSTENPETSLSPVEMLGTHPH